MYPYYKPKYCEKCGEEIFNQRNLCGDCEREEVKENENS